MLGVFVLVSGFMIGDTSLSPCGDDVRRPLESAIAVGQVIEGTSIKVGLGPTFCLAPHAAGPHYDGPPEAWIPVEVVGVSPVTNEADRLALGSVAGNRRVACVAEAVTAEVVRARCGVAGKPLRELMTPK